MELKNKEIQNALDKVIAIRNKRQETYGDRWEKDPIEYDVWMVYGKLQRAFYQIEHQPKNAYEKMEDSLIDLINYALFALCKVYRGKNGKYKRY